MEEEEGEDEGEEEKKKRKKGLREIHRSWKDITDERLAGMVVIF